MPLAAILEARERRWRIKRELAQRFRACVLSLCLNIPGPDKNPPVAEQAFAQLQAALRAAHARELRRVPRAHPKGWFVARQTRAPRVRRQRYTRAAGEKAYRACCSTVMYETAGTGADGPFRLMVSPLSGFTLKRMAVRLEREHPLGRLADIDILTPAGEPVSRADLGLAPRACYLCGEPASLCRRRQQHPQQQLVNFTVALLETAMADTGEKHVRMS
jgi:holo-ACP synthase CitX